ncbi:putative disease resistance protein RGA3 [Salvia miltiorrhiza]|uniref:putative disease resistance protein RGA3 n=1 Tax=Salvia miltiorrhiza TaxID=226208 RepID=UPI0025ABECC7|nr:putative disease resistance protein RGA3 [Salvia miltiorrhiza]
MEGGAATDVLQVLVQNLIDLSKKEISQIRGLDKDAAKLAGSLDMIKNFLNDAETRNITNEAVKCWLKKLENEAFDADNVLDELNYHILSKKIKASKPMKAKVLSRFSSPFNSIARPRKMAVRIQEINENLESIKKEATDLGLVARLAIEPTLVDAAIFETDSFTLDPIFIGRDDIASEIVGMLTNSITTDDGSVSILAIVGMGGLGKTTLTRKVFNCLKNETRFGLHIWVHVSPNFDPIILFKKILKEVSQQNKQLPSNQVESSSKQDILSKPDQVEIESKQDILSELQKALKDKTYLLILDDVWNQDVSKWEGFMNSLLGVSGCVKGNAIIVTTRNMEVASIVNTIHIHELKGLSEEECWSIIRAKAFGKKDVPSEFEAIGRKIARRCQGLPLAANIVGGVLHDKSEDKWRSIEEKWLSPKEGGDNITKILRLSFDNLSPPFLKKCFAYCAMFPKGSEIMKQELIEKIFNYKGKRFPLWTEKMSVRDALQGSWVLLNNLMSLRLWYCRKSEEIPMLGHLPNLKSLGLIGLRNLKCINSSFYGMVNKDTRIVFPALERLELKDMPKLEEWAEIEISDGSEVKLFPRLRYLEIKWCEQLMSVPSHVSSSCLESLTIGKIGVECLPADWLLSNSETLSYLRIEGCLNLREISDRCGEEESEGRSFPITSLPNFPRLTTLTIEDVPELSLETVNAMRRLQIDGYKHIDP